MQGLFGVPGETATFFFVELSSVFFSVVFTSGVLPLVDRIDAGDFSEAECLRFFVDRVSAV